MKKTLTTCACVLLMCMHNLRSKVSPVVQSVLWSSPANRHYPILSCFSEKDPRFCELQLALTPLSTVCLQCKCYCCNKEEILGTCLSSQKKTLATLTVLDGRGFVLSWKHYSKFSYICIQCSKWLLSILCLLGIFCILQNWLVDACADGSALLVLS